MIRELAERVLGRELSRQLSGPSGVLGTFVARQLNQGNRRAIAAAVSDLELHGGETVVDIGFGGGIGLRLLRDAVGASGTVHGVEPSHDMVVRAHRVHGDGVQLHEAPMEHLPFGNGALDGWISLNTIYFIPDLAPALAELARVLSPHGRGVLGIGDPAWMAEQRFTRHRFTLRPVAEVVAALESAGLAIDDHVLEGGPAAYHLLRCRRT